MNTRKIIFKGENFENWTINLPPVGEGMAAIRVGSLVSCGGHCYTQIRKRPTTVLHFMLSGAGVIRNGDHSYRVGCDDLFVFYSGEKYTHYDLPEAPWSYLYLEIAGEKIVDLLQLCGITPDNPVARGVAGQLATLLAARIEMLENTPISMLEGELIANEIMYCLCRLLIPHKQEKSKPLSERILDYINTSGRYDIRIKELADIFGVNRTTLFRAFKQSYQITLSEHLRNLKLVHGAELLKHPELTIQEIAFKLNFGSPQHFINAFHHEFGTSPAKYRQGQLVREKEETSCDRSLQLGEGGF